MTKNQRGVRRAGEAALKPAIVKVLWKRFIPAFFVFFVLNFSIRAVFLGDLGYLNEDAALMLGARDSISQHGILYWFIHSYGPQVIRPLQLISFWLDWQIFHALPLIQHIENIALVSVSQSLIVVTLVSVFGRLSLLLLVLPLSMAFSAAEPNLWLSDRHDLILLVFFSCAMVADWKISSGVVRGVVLFFCFLGAFFSNEKGLVTPASIVCISLALSPWSIDLRRVRPSVTAAGLAYLFYFPLRAFVLHGQVIGGYDERIFPDVISAIGLGKWVLTLISSPFRGGMYVPWLEVIFPFFLLIPITSSRVRKQVSSSTLVLLGANLLLLGLPTIRFSPALATDHIFSSRMLWLPLFGSALLVSYLVERYWQAKLRWVNLFVVSWWSIAVCSLVIGNVRSLQYFVHANQASAKAFAEYSGRCGCTADPARAIVGLPVHVDTVNTFTESQWLIFDAKFHELPHCTSECPLVAYPPNGDLELYHLLSSTKGEDITTCKKAFRSVIMHSKRVLIQGMPYRLVQLSSDDAILRPEETLYLQTKDLFTYAFSPRVVETSNRILLALPGAPRPRDLRGWLTLPQHEGCADIKFSFAKQAQNERAHRRKP